MQRWTRSQVQRKRRTRRHSVPKQRLAALVVCPLHKSVASWHSALSALFRALCCTVWRSSCMHAAELPKVSTSTALSAE